MAADPQGKVSYVDQAPPTGAANNPKSSTARLSERAEQSRLPI
jgi:hypothetical protein